MTLEVRIAVEVTAPIGYFELMVPDGGIVARDVNLGTAVEVAADTGATFPLSSGITRFEAPPRELATGFARSHAGDARRRRRAGAGGDPVAAQHRRRRRRS